MRERERDCVCVGEEGGGGMLFVEKYFNLTRPLYFDFTHLVCCSAIDGEIGEAECVCAWGRGKEDERGKEV